MYIQQTEYALGKFSTDIYPFSDTADDAMFLQAITVADGKVHWRGREWTRDEANEWLAKLQAGFDEAFRVVANAAPGEEGRDERTK